MQSPEPPVGVDPSAEEVVVGVEPSAVVIAVVVMQSELVGVGSGVETGVVVSVVVEVSHSGHWKKGQKYESMRNV